jgi:hypothetical protein
MLKLAVAVLLGLNTPLPSTDATNEHNPTALRTILGPTTSQVSGVVLATRAVVVNPKVTDLLVAVSLENQSIPTLFQVPSE